MSQKERITPLHAVARAWLTITLPSVAILAVPVWAYLFWLPEAYREGLRGVALFAVIVFLFGGGAWLLWSVLVPRWRLWAYERVDNISKLKTLAVLSGVIWREGSIFERTEIASPELRQRIARVEAEKGAKK